MKRMFATLLILNLAWGAVAIDKISLDQKTQNLLAKFETMQAKPDKRVPAEVLRQARGINRVYYCTELDMQQILFDKRVKPTETATALARKFDEYAKPH